MRSGLSKNSFNNPVLAALVLAIGLTSGVVAQAQLEEVIVTARKVEESQQEVPVAVSALSGEQLENSDARNIFNLNARVPNLHIPNNTVLFSAPAPYIRGAGRSEANWNAENAVAIFVDDVYMQSSAVSTIDMIDWGSVEVLRGPQGTLYGRNATTGAIKFIPKRPELQETRTKAAATFGSNSRLDFKLSHSQPLIRDRLGVQFDFYRVEDDGYLTQVDESNTDIDSNFGHKKNIGGRIGLLWTPTDRLEFELNFDGRVEENGITLLTPILPNDPTDFTQLLSKRGTVEYEPVFGINRVAGQPLLGDGFDLSAYNLIFKGTLETDFGTFKSITGYRWYDEDYFSQLGGRGAPSTAFGVTLFSHVDSFNRFEQFTQELQLSTDIGERIDVTAGVYYFQNDWSQLQYNGVLFPVEASIGLGTLFTGAPFVKPGAPASFGGVYLDTFQDSESWAVYADATWQIFDQVALFFGGRFLEDRKRVNYDTRFENNSISLPGFPLTTSEKWDKFTPRIGAEWQMNDDLMLYVSYSEGFRSGVLEGARATTASLASSWLAPEVVETIEFGLKADWLDGRIRTNVAVFLSDYNDKADLISPEEAATADAEINGVEIETSWAVTSDLTIWGTVGFMDAKYTDAEADHPIFNPRSHRVCAGTGCRTGRNT